MIPVSLGSGVLVLCPNAIDRAALVGSLSLDIIAKFIFSVFTQHYYFFIFIFGSSRIQDWLYESKCRIQTKFLKLEVVELHLL